MVTQLIEIIGVDPMSDPIGFTIGCVFVFYFMQLIVYFIKGFFGYD